MHSQNEKVTYYVFAFDLVNFNASSVSADNILSLFNSYKYHHSSKCTIEISKTIIDRFTVLQRAKRDISVGSNEFAIKFNQFHQSAREDTRILLICRHLKFFNLY